VRILGRPISMPLRVCRIVSLALTPPMARTMVATHGTYAHVQTALQVRASQEARLATSSAAPLASDRPRGPHCASFAVRQSTDLHGQPDQGEFLKPSFCLSKSCAPWPLLDVVQGIERERWGHGAGSVWVGAAEEIDIDLLVL